MTFNNVVVPTAGLYTVDWRYAFQCGLFPGVNNRQMGLSVNGTVITRTAALPDHRQLRDVPALVRCRSTSTPVSTRSPSSRSPTTDCPEWTS